MDKTSLITEIIRQEGTEVFLFTRPRRFGKSLNMSMIDAFFNVKYKGNRWFDGLSVSSDENSTMEMNRYPVINLSMKNLNCKDMDTFLDKFSRQIKNVCRDFRYILDSDMDEIQLEQFRKLSIGTMDKVDLEYSLKDICDIISSYHNEKVIILIDEYDEPMNNTFNVSVQKDIIEFLRELMSYSLKGNRNLKFGVITGVMQVAKESIFSGLNNLYVNNIHSKSFDECYGFTESEVKSLLEYYGHPEKFDLCKEWYDGYRFGASDVYNPWSVIYFVRNDFEAKPYWASTSNNEIVRTLIHNADEEIMENIRLLGSGEHITSDLNEHVTYSEVEKDDVAIYSVMTMTGYLNSVEEGDSYSLSIPNREIFNIFMDSINFGNNGSSIRTNIRKLARAIKSGNVDEMTAVIHKLLMDVISARVLDNEHVYQGLLIGMLMAFCGEYEIYGDSLETGDGFADIIFRKKKRSDVNIIIELKKSREEEDVVKDAGLAMEQIFERNYFNVMDGRTILYGISFHSKKPFIITKTIFCDDGIPRSG